LRLWRGGVVDTVQDCIRKVNEFIEIVDILHRNTEISGEYYQYLNNFMDVLTSKYLCEVCHEIKRDEYNLRSIVNEGLKYTLSTLEDLKDKETIDTIKSYIDSLGEIGLEIPTELLNAMPVGENIAKIDKTYPAILFECGVKHGAVDTALKSVYEADVLARTAANVFNELKKPILEKAEEMFKELDRTGADLRKERLAIAPFEQLYNQLDLELMKVRSEIESSNYLLDILKKRR